MIHGVISQNVPMGLLGPPPDPGMHEIKPDPGRVNRRDNNGAIFRAGAAEAGKVVLSKCSLYMPLVMPSDMEKLTHYKSIESKTSLNVGYRMSVTVPQSTSFSWRLSVKSSPEKTPVGFCRFFKQERTVIKYKTQHFLIIVI